MSLYNIKSAEDHFIITKFDDDLNVESSYEYHINPEVCHCPAGLRPSCRHRQMFPQLVDRVDTAWFLDFDTRAWVDPILGFRPTESDPLPEGVTAFDLEDPKTIHNAIAEAVGEPEAIITVPDSHPFRRRM